MKQIFGEFKMNKTAKHIARFAAIGLISTSTLLPLHTVWADDTTQATAVTTTNMTTTDANASALESPLS